MENAEFKVLILEPAQKYIDSLSKPEQGAVRADMSAMESGDFDSVYTKMLKGKVRELIVGRHRISYFTIGSTLHFVRGFPKKSAKTPIKEIAYAEQVYKLMK
ncbi:MAG: type II toxin-antitoxin system RelE/ParE family toxin [bacterium]|nr:type II toxin-antitoxin system RelE/ParE family toxin [bacterium]